MIQTVLDHRTDYGNLNILWAARHPSLLVFTDEYEEWRQSPSTDLYLTVDQPDERWTYNIGLITDLLSRVAPSPVNAVSIICGPPVMIHFVNKLLVEQLGFLPSSELCYPGGTHALRNREMWALQPGREIDLCRRTSLQHGRSRWLTGEFPVIRRT